MRIVLFQPEIPQNTGNIVRTCAVTGCELFLVRPLGFSLSERHLKRAGLDYWKDASINVIDDLPSFLENASARFFFFSSKATARYTDIEFKHDDILIFGSETTGLPEVFLERWPEQFRTIPMKAGARCLNLANAVSIVIYEGWRQLDFAVL